MRIRIIALCFVASLVGRAVAPLGAQSLADVARQEAERRKAIRTPSKVITNTDLKPVIPPETPAPAPAPTATTTPDATPAAEGAAASSDAAKPADASGGEAKDKDQAYWSGRLKVLQTQLEHDQSFADALQVKINTLTADFVSRDDPGQRATIDKERTKALTELEGLKKAIVGGQKAIADLQEEARRAGVPPGWLR